MVDLNFFSFCTHNALIHDMIKFQQNKNVHMNVLENSLPLPKFCAAHVPA